MDNSRQSRLLEQSRLNQSMPPPTDEQQLAFLAKIQRFFPKVISLPPINLRCRSSLRTWQ